MNIPIFPTCISVSAIALFCVLTTISKGETYVWQSESDFPDTFELAPGDKVIIKPGTYHDVSTQFVGGGDLQQQVIVEAEEAGSVKFLGRSGFGVNGNYITLSGLVFDGRPENFDSSPKQFLDDNVGPLSDPKSMGGPPSYNGMVVFSENSTGCRLTNSFFSNFDRSYDDYPKGMNYIMLRGFENEIDHCTFEHKRSLNATIFIKPDPGKEAGPSVERNHYIHHNYFGERNYVGKNGWETIRISDSSKQDYDLACVIDSNYFYRAILNPGSLSKEKEIISNKSRKNKYINNVFEECDGQITLRHGRDCLVENNWFLGKGSNGATGVRIIGTGHTVKGNVFSDLDGIEYAATLTTMQGGYGIVNNQYEGVEDILIEGNLFLNCAQPINMSFANGRGEDYDSPPRNLSMIGNRILSNESGYPMFVFASDLTTSGVWKGNEYYNSASQESYGDVPSKGWKKKKSLEINLGEPPVDREATGVSF
ncbi:polysaccharide lyase 6 family protein [Puniceicoccaceae bacterium K14]|nr:polysaccharide lyase 6 family protein [Puniceicoccaceae bacterium K14]